MVTAGVYLIARMNVIFTLSSVAMSVVALIGTFTLIIAGFSALVQHDIKRVLAYSTISQIGYMFLALGVGAWSAAVFHFFTHAFFKALLFLAAGVVILKTGHEHDMFKMGGLRKKMPLLFYTFLAGAASLSALPLITAGFFSKDLILTEVFAFANGGKILWIAGLAGAGLTALYTFRMVFITFYGELKTEPDPEISPLMSIPLVTLAILSIFSGFIEIPGMHAFSAFMHKSLPEFHGTEGDISEFVLQLISGITAIAGLFLAYWLYVRNPQSISSLKKNNGLKRLGQFWENGWGFDYMYDKLFVLPYVSLSKINRNDIMDKLYTGLAILVVLIHKQIIRTQNGRLRWYIAFIVSGLLIGLTIIVFI
jgi:NADH-quinone oxidoreductase subunit L